MPYKKVPEHFTDLPDDKFKDHVRQVLLSKVCYRLDHYVNDSGVWR